MEAENEISMELRSLSDLVSGISRHPPYEVPAGYFEGLPARILSRIAAKSSTFDVPEGYFEGFAAQVLARIRSGAATGSQADGHPGSAGVPAVEGAGEELARLSPFLSGLSRETPYQLPAGYFEEVSPVLAVLRDRSAYQAPDGYFEELSPLLTVLRDQPAYEVPAGYFEELAPAVLARVTQPAASPARVVPMHNRGKVLKGSWWKYSSVGAVAACLILVFSWPQLNSDVLHTKEIKPQSLAELTPNLHNVSDQEIQDYLDDESAILAEPVTSSTATLDINDNDVKNFLGHVPDGELQQYIDEHGRANDIATN